MERARAVARWSIVLAVLVTVWDVASIRFENPNSFDGAGDLLHMLAASFALSAVAVLIASLALALVLRAARRDSLRTVAVVGLAAWFFLWTSVRVHVHWFFGESLTSARSLSATALVLLVSVGVAWLVCRWASLALSWTARSAWVFVLVPAMIVPGLLAARASTGSASAPAPAPSPMLRDVLLVTLDTTRADHLSAFGYPRGTSPNLDRLARTAGWVGTMVTPVPLTNPSHVSLLTGLSPREHGVRNNGTSLGAGVATVTQQLAAHGMRCAAFVSGIPLKKAWSGLGPGFERYDDAFSPLEAIHPMLTSSTIVRTAARVLPFDLLERRGSSTAAAARAWIRATPGPRFVWVHLFDPHTPYQAPRPLRDRFALESAGGRHGDHLVTGWPIADYDAEVRAVDDALGAVVHEFHRSTNGTGAVVVVSDHGEGLYDHGELTHGAQLFDEDIRVPVIVASDDAPATTLAPEAILSTTALADALVALAEGRWPEIRETAAAISETFPPEGHRRRTAIVVGAGRGGGARKLVVDWEGAVETRYDLDADPRESRSAADGPTWTDARRQAVVPTDTHVGDDLDAETVRKLRALGYVH